MKLLTDNIDKLHAMAELLIKCETIYTEEVNDIMNGVSNDEIIKKLEERQKAEEEELKKEKQMQEEAEKKRLEEIKSRAFEAMKQSGIIVEEMPKNQPQTEQKPQAEQVADKNNNTGDSDKNDGDNNQNE